MRSLQLSCILFLVCNTIADVLANVAAGERNLRGLLDELSVEPATFRITIIETVVEGEDGVLRLSDEEERVSCIPIIDGKESDELYAIDLPSKFIKANRPFISTGKLFVSITLTEILGSTVVLSKNSNITVISVPRSAERVANPSTTGTKTMAIVRISTSDVSPDYDATTLRETLFSLDKVNFRTQYMNCSFGQLEWLLAPAGIVEVLVNQPISDFTSGAELVTAAQNTLKETLGIEDVSSLGDKVLMCLPPGTGGWVANSGVNHWRAQFNNEWCLSLTATMHEM
jgi:hypothetical protein